MLPEKRADRPALLFVHGAWQSAWIWQHLWMPYFVSYGYPCYAMSLRGHGRSEGADRVRNTSVMEYAGDVLRVMSQMDEVPVLVGHDMGAFVALKALESLSAPGAALIGPVPIQGTQFKALTRAAMKSHWWAAFRSMLSGRALDFVKSPGVWRSLAFAPDTPPDIAANAVLHLTEESHSAMRDLGGRVPIYRDRIRTPILVLGGTEDRMTPLDSMAKVAELLDAPFERMPRMGHCLMMEPLWREAAARLQDWLEGRIPLRNSMASRAGHTIEPVAIDVDLGEDDTDSSEYGYEEEMETDSEKTDETEASEPSGTQADVEAGETEAYPQESEPVTPVQAEAVSEPAPSIVPPSPEPVTQTQAAEPADPPEEIKPASPALPPAKNAQTFGVTELPRARELGPATLPGSQPQGRPITQRIVMTPIARNKTPNPAAERYFTLPNNNIPERIRRAPQKRETSASGAGKD